MGRAKPITGRSTRSIKPQKARNLINKFHALNKAREQAKNDTFKVHQIDAELEKLGGLKTYQAASICGQSGSRGGDSSKILMQWLPKTFQGSLLEVGCLQVDNCCAQSKLFNPHIRIDLNSQHPDIKEQDFLTMEVPTTKFNIISLSLVVNYAPKSDQRGAMLLKAHECLINDGLLFFVLPRACVDNSRYCNDKIIGDVFESVGFRSKETKKTLKLVYWLLEKTNGTNQEIKKIKVRDGPNMNNFCITI